MEGYNISIWGILYMFAARFYSRTSRKNQSGSGYFHYLWQGKLANGCHIQVYPQYVTGVVILFEDYDWPFSLMSLHS